MKTTFYVLAAIDVAALAVVICCAVQIYRSSRRMTKLLEEMRGSIS